MKRLVFVSLLVAVGGCASAPDEQDYCRSYGVEQGNPEFAKCTDHYFQQEAIFGADRAVCDREADITYPKSLYSRPTSYPARFYGGSGIGFSRGGFGGGYGGLGFGRTEMVHVGADYQQIAEVDRLRMTIIEPCMRKRGWQSGQTWQAGRIAPTKAVPSKPLPWVK